MPPASSAEVAAPALPELVGELELGGAEHAASRASEPAPARAVRT